MQGNSHAPFSGGKGAERLLTYPTTSSGNHDLMAMKNKTDIAPSETIKKLTVEDIRTVKGYENLSYEEAEKLLFSLKQYCSMLTEFFTQKQSL